MNKIWIVGLAAMMGACASDANWIAIQETDEFTDIKKCTVTVGSAQLGFSPFLITYSGHFYPFIRTVKNDITVGVRSGGKIRLPVGEVQLRIDGNKAWRITTAETPLEFAPRIQLGSTKEFVKSLPPESQKLLAGMNEANQNVVSRMLSPYTSATGDKANNILREMLGGRKLIYRKVGPNRAGSSTGEYPLDDSLRLALQECGIALAR